MSFCQVLGWERVGLREHKRGKKGSIRERETEEMERSESGGKVKWRGLWRGVQLG